MQKKHSKHSTVSKRQDLHLCMRPEWQLQYKTCFPWCLVNLLLRNWMIQTRCQPYQTQTSGIMAPQGLSFKSRKAWGTWSTFWSLLLTPSSRTMMKAKPLLGNAYISQNVRDGALLLHFSRLSEVASQRPHQKGGLEDNFSVRASHIWGNTLWKSCGPGYVWPTGPYLHHC